MPPYDSGSRFDRDIEKQEEIDKRRLARIKDKVVVTSGNFWDWIVGKWRREP